METITTPPAGVIVKSDSTSRTPYTSHYKAEVLAAYQRSSLSAPVFAKQCGIKYPTFAAWIAARKAADQTTSRTATPAFLVAEVAACSDAQDGILEVHLPGGAIARAADAEQIRLLATLLRQLA